MANSVLRSPKLLRSCAVLTQARYMLIPKQILLQTPYRHNRKAYRCGIKLCPTPLRTRPPLTFLSRPSLVLMLRPGALPPPQWPLPAVKQLKSTTRYRTRPGRQPHPPPDHPPPHPTHSHAVRKISPMHWSCVHRSSLKVMSSTFTLAPLIGLPAWINCLTVCYAMYLPMSSLIRRPATKTCGWWPSISAL